jgi:transcriptional repressor NrdR
MRCPFCSDADSKVVDSRPTEEGTAIRRRRECNNCSRRFTTYEKIESLPILVIKKDGRRETFDSDKIMSGLLKACEKRPVAMKDLFKKLMVYTILLISFLSLFIIRFSSLDM